MDRTIPLKAIEEPRERPVVRAIDKLQEENAQLRELVIQLTNIAVRNALDRK